MFFVVVVVVVVVVFLLREFYNVRMSQAAEGISFKFFLFSVPVIGPVVAQRVGRGIALLFHDRGTRRG